MRKALNNGTCGSAPTTGPDQDQDERVGGGEAEVMAKRDGAGPATTAAPAMQALPHRGEGSTLAPAARAFLEPRLGHDFGDVRVHTDSGAAGIARSMNAAAFTLGHHIYFGAGRYSPATDSGRRLLAHELTHVVQQRRTATPFLLRRYTLNGFPPAEAAAMRAAIPVAISKVRSCSDISWWGRRMTRIAIGDRRYDYVPDLGDCGWTFPGSWYIEIGKTAFDPAACCDLASTIAHEASHTQLYTEGRARRLECKCFGCSC